jgi:hypothetical protein
MFLTCAHSTTLNLTRKTSSHLASTRDATHTLTSRSAAPLPHSAQQHGGGCTQATCAVSCRSTALRLSALVEEDAAGANTASAARALLASCEDWRGRHSGRIGEGDTVGGLVRATQWEDW